MPTTLALTTKKLMKQVIVKMANHIRQSQQERSQKYLIRVEGRISEKWAGWFEGLSIAVEQLEDDLSITTLTGEVVDQAALQGLLQKLYNLGFHLIEVTRKE